MELNIVFKNIQILFLWGSFRFIVNTNKEIGKIVIIGVL